MATTNGRKNGRILSRITVAAIAAALVGTMSGAHAAENPQPTLKKSAVAPAKAQPKGNLRAAAPAAVSVAQALMTSEGDDLYSHLPNGLGGYDAREIAGTGWTNVKAGAQVDNDADGTAESAWIWDNAGYQYHSGPNETEFTQVGSGWNMYTRVFSPGNLGGASAYDILGRDANGVLWLYLGYGDGKSTSRIRVGDGWNYNQIFGLGDLTGDGKADVLGRDGATGFLWLHPGTGDYKAPFGPRIKAGTGWNMHNNIIGAGDVDLDGTADLIARGNDGALWRYSGNANATTPLKGGVKISAENWNKYRLMF
ncbi:FG-GAP repeat domain-containing protein [Streptomyces sp. NPDC051561]|uniref:FG-GAP repeat domain-containing protein n=1 Tax=Streptomyces sp. NPDC051561 TaxID=3365658 RepID=UPI003791518B